MSLDFIGEEQTLKDILTTREERVQYQQYLLKKYGKTIVSYKLNIPGPIKYNSLIKEIFDEGLLSFKSKLNDASIGIVDEHIVYKNSGPEYFAVIDIPSLIIKELTAKIEETHALGRIYDFDVLNSKGEHIERQEVGIEVRKCLLCDRNAIECGRSRNHEVSELIDKIESIALHYLGRK